VTIQGEPIDDALIVPTAALRFVPSTLTKKAIGGQVWVIDGDTATADGGTSTTSTPATTTTASGTRAPRSGTDAGAINGGDSPTSSGTPRAIDVTVLARAGARVQVSGEGLSAGTRVIVEETGKKKTGHKPPRVF
jgi:hypothetical protein